jgi:hypothetical protein
MSQTLEVIEFVFPSRSYTSCRYAHARNRDFGMNTYQWDTVHNFQYFGTLIWERIRPTGSCIVEIYIRTVKFRPTIWSDKLLRPGLREIQHIRQERASMHSQGSLCAIFVSRGRSHILIGIYRVRKSPFNASRTASGRIERGTGKETWVRIKRNNFNDGRRYVYIQDWILGTIIYVKFIMNAVSVIDT